MTTYLQEIVSIISVKEIEQFMIVAAHNLPVYNQCYLHCVVLNVNRVPPSIIQAVLCHVDCDVPHGVPLSPGVLDLSLVIHCNSAEHVSVRYFINDSMVSCIVIVKQKLKEDVRTVLMVTR